MIIYLLVLFFCVCGCLLYSTKRVKIQLPNNNYYKFEHNGVLFWLIAISMLLITAFRGLNVGIDTVNYYQDFLKYRNESFSLLRNYSLFDEIGYEFLAIFFNKLGLGWPLFSLFMASLYMVPVYVLISKNNINGCFPLLIFILSGFWFYSMSTMRQAAAIGITIIAFLVNKKKILSFLLILLASTIHISALIFLLYYVIKPLKFDRKNIYIWFICGVVFFTLGLSPARTYMFQFIEIFGRSYSEVQVSAGILQEIFFVVTLIVSVFFTDEDFYKLNGEYLKFIYLASLLLPVVYINPTLFRIYQYFSIYQIIIIPMLLHNIKKAQIRIVGYICYLIVYFYLFVESLDSSMQLTPYYFFK